MTTLHDNELETLRDDFCYECGHVVAEQVAGLSAVHLEQPKKGPEEPGTQTDDDTQNAMGFLYKAGLQEEYML